MKRIFCLISIFCIAFSVSSAEIRGEVAKVINGNTFILREKSKSPFLETRELLGAFKVRLMYTKAPEDAKEEGIGTRAQNVLAILIDSKEVVVHFKTIDKDGTVVGIVRVNRFGESVNESVLRRGWAYYRREGDDISPEYAALEASSKEKGWGIWGDEIIRIYD